MRSRFIGPLFSSSTESHFINNRADGSGGGALYASAADVAAHRNLFERNIGIAGSVVLSTDQGSVLLDSSRMNDNSSLACTAYALGGTIQVQNVTSVQNAEVAGRAACNLADGVLEVYSSILYNGGEEILESDGSVFVSRSDVQLPAGVFPGPGNINADPMLLGPYFLLPHASPCADAGSVPLGSTDLYGFNRLMGTTMAFQPWIWAPTKFIFFDDEPGWTEA